MDEQVVSGESPFVLLPSRLTNCLTRLLVVAPVLLKEADRCASIWLRLFGESVELLLAGLCAKVDSRAL